MRALKYAALGVLLALPAAAQTAQVGVNAAIRNSVETRAASEAVLHPAIIRAPVRLGDAVVSGEQSALQILLLDRSVFTVGSNARMTIDRFVYDPNRGASDVAASVAKGAFRFMSGRSLTGQGASAITTPVATIGVRGTIVEGAIGGDALYVLQVQPGMPAFSGDPAGVSLVLLGGPGHGSQGFDKPGAIDVRTGGGIIAVEHAGQAVVVWGGSQPPTGPFTLSDAAYARLEALLSPPPANGDEHGPRIDSAYAASGHSRAKAGPRDEYPGDINGSDTPGINNGGVGGPKAGPQAGFPPTGTAP